MLHKVNKAEKTEKSNSLALCDAKCIICDTKIQLTTNSDKDDAICYECFQKMWGKRYYQTNQTLKKVVGN